MHHPTAGLLALAAAALIPLPAQATWSIVAVDLETREVGIAGATCGPFVWGIAEIVPGVGAVASQYYTRRASKKTAAEELEAGATPAEALAVITDPDFDGDLAYRQFGVAGLSGPAVAYTGADCERWYGALTEEDFSVQGNTLVGEPVVQAAHQAYIDAAGEPMEERLLQALEAGAAEGGDQRCDFDVAAESAFVFVALPDDRRPTIDLTASDKDGAVAALREKYESGKTQNCHCSTSGRARFPGWVLLIGLLSLARRRASRP